MPSKVRSRSSGTVGRVTGSGAELASAVAFCGIVMLWVCTWSPASIGLLAIPMTCPYLCTRAPVGMVRRAILCPRGMSLRATVSPAGTPLATGSRAIATSSTPRCSRRAAMVVSSWDGRVVGVRGNCTRPSGRSGGCVDAVQDPVDGQLDIRDLDACRSALIGADAVVHLGAVSDPAAGWNRLLPANGVGTYTIARAAVDCGGRRLVLASSLHAMSAAPPGYQMRSEDQPRPGNLYGATKAWAEALGAWVSATSTTSAVALRIGYFAEHRPDPATTPPQELSAWLSPRDAAELVRAAVEADLPGFTVANGISANRYRVADLAATISRLHYRPIDD